MIGFLNECGRVWVEPFGLMVVQNTVFLGLIFAALYWLRNASARLRHIVALVGLVKLIVPPFVPTRVTTAPSYVELPVLTSLPHRPVAAITNATVADPTSLTLAGLLFCIWCAIAAAVLARALIATVGLHVSLRDAILANDDDSREWSRRTGIRVSLSDRVAVPMTVGLFPRRIFVPSHWASWSAAGRQAILRHEVAHIHRRDGVVNLLETVVCALYWFHPLVLLLTRHTSAYREQACDEAAASPDRFGRLVYSRLLVEIAEHLMHRAPLRGSASALMKRRNKLLDRVHYLTKGESTMSLSKTRAAALTVTLVIAVLSLSWYHGAATPPPPPKDHTNVEMSLAKDGGIAVDGRKANLENLEEVLGIQVDGQKAIITITCGENVPMSTLFAVHTVLRTAGTYKVRYTGLDSPPLPLVLPSQDLIEKAKSFPTEHIAHLEVGTGEQCTLDGVTLKPSMIQDAVGKRVVEDEMLVVSLKMANDATYGQYVQTLEALKAAQANRIFINEPGTL